jgi:ribosome maturation factor RimP
MAGAKLDALRNMLEPAVKAAGMELWGLEFLPQGRHSVLRLYIDSEQGVTIDNCEAVSHQASAVLDVEDPISGEYHLEVSSPGMDRPLFNIAQCARYVGQEMKVRLRLAVEGKRRFTATLVATTEDACVFDTEGVRLTVSMHNIEKLNLEPRFD